MPHANVKQGEQAITTVRFRHEGAIGDKFDDAKRALGLFAKAREGFEQQSHALNAKTMKREELLAYWLEVYTDTLDEIPANPVTTEEKKREQAPRKSSPDGRRTLTVIEREQATEHRPG